MGDITPNMSIYIPSPGETNYDTSFAAGMRNVDSHDHSGGPNKGVPLTASGLADGSVTKTKLATDVVTAGEGLAIDLANPNALKADGLLNSIYKIAVNGFIARTGAGTASARTLTTATPTRVTFVNPAGTAGDPQINVSNEIPAINPYPGAWVTEDGSSVRWYNPRNTYFIHEEFLGRYSTASAVFRSAIFSHTVVGSTIETTGAFASAAHPGVIVLSTGALATDVVGIQTDTTCLLFGGGRMILNFMIRIPTLSDGTDRYNLYLGFGDTLVAGEFVDGAYFIYSDNINSGNWRLSTASNSTRTTFDTSTAVDTNWHLLTVDVNAAGTLASFFIDGSSVGTINTNIPTGAGRQFGIDFKMDKALGTNPRSLEIDFATFYNLLTATR